MAWRQIDDGASSRLVVLVIVTFSVASKLYNTVLCFKTKCFISLQYQFILALHSAKKWAIAALGGGYLIRSNIQKQ
jgi:hypothetical protein